MRLVQVSDDGALTITSDLIGHNNLPPYAVISHNWQEPKDEVMFEDLVHGLAHTKPGFRKLQLIAQRVQNDGLKFFWIDTCCIDTTNHAELQETINSIYGWLQSAFTCYAYLSDVSTSESEASVKKQGFFMKDTEGNDWIPAFDRSRWFTRYWTLQELLAPPRVVFLSKEGYLLGERAELAQRIHKITGIPVAALEQTPLRDFSVEERLSWAQKRKAQREEDSAYSLLGIFNVFLPILYGEGQQSALSRLHKAIQWSMGKDAREQELQNRNRLKYHPLKDTDIRILVLHPGELDDDLQAHLETSKLSGSLNYQALSYVWGLEPALHAVQFPENETLLIRPNLFHALRRLRLPYESVRLWVDSICIHQADELEKNDQVGRMGEIFRQARNVWIWLGEEYGDSNRLMDLVAELVNPNRHDALLRPYDITALNNLLGRPWFRRGWVIQEAALSPNSIVFCGNRQVDWRRLARVVEHARFVVRHNLVTPNSTNGPSQLGLDTDGLRESSACKLFDISANVFRLQDDGRVVKTMTLEELVDLGTVFETTDPRDAIYALLNLAKDSTSELGGIVPDYRKSCLEVFADFVLHCCHESKSLDILCRPWAPTHFMQANVATQNELLKSIEPPSWIVTRDKLPFGEPSRRHVQRLHSASLVGQALLPGHNASFDTQPQAKIYTNNDGGVPKLSLITKGMLIGVVTHTSLRMAGAVITQDCLNILESVYPSADDITRILCADMLRRRVVSSQSQRDEGRIVPQRHDAVVVAWVRRTLFNRHAEVGPNVAQPASGLDVEEILDSDAHAEIRHWLELVRQYVWNRRTFRGHLMHNAIAGLIPQASRVGDKVCILYGCSVPVILRRLETGQYRLVGEAYVHGFMDGEARKSFAETEFEIQ